MKIRRMNWAMAACVLGAAVLPAAGQPTDLPLDAVVKRASEALARLEFNVSNELIGERRRVGQCICIDAQRGMFVTGDVPGSVPAGEMNGFRLRQAGNVGPWYAAKLISRDPEEDLAFLQLDLKSGQKNPWKALTFASSRDLRIGQRVVSVGMLPEGYGNAPYMGTGVVAGLFRLPDKLVFVSGGSLTIGSSPVLSMDGRMIGIVGGQMPVRARIILGNRPVETALTQRDRTHYFIPTDEFAHVVRNIGPRKLPWTGAVGLQLVAENVAEGMPGLKGRPAAQVGRILPNTPATRAGLKQSDIIVGLNGKALEAMPTRQLVVRAFYRALNRLKPGDKVRITVLRDGKDEVLTLTLTPRPATPAETPRYYNRRLGLAARDLTRVEIETQPDIPKRGALVTAIRQKSAAADGRMAPGDLIREVNTRPIRNVAELNAILQPLAASTKTITFKIVRRGAEEVLVVSPPQPPVTP